MLRMHNPTNNPAEQPAPKSNPGPAETPTSQPINKPTGNPANLRHNPTNNPAAADSGQAALQPRSACTLHELGVEQPLPTATCEDNNGTIRLMPKAQQPTRRTRHVLNSNNMQHCNVSKTSRPAYARHPSPEQPLTSKFPVFARNCYFDLLDHSDLATQSPVLFIDASLAC